MVADGINSQIGDAPTSKIDVSNLGFDERKRAEARKRAQAALQEKQKRAGVKADPFLRAPNEDDDGYDPYSDRIEQTSPWEEDPWR